MSNGCTDSNFVGTPQTLIDQATLENILERCIGPNGWQFLRWPHTVEFWEISKTTDFSCETGQAFDEKCELRWKKHGDAYEMLLLSTTGADDDFESIGPTWRTEDLEAESYKRPETRFPKVSTVPEELTLGQRYFIDIETASVQFVALRVIENGSK